MKQNDAESKKPLPFLLQIFLYVYGLLWLNMIFIAGLNSLRLGYADYDSGSIALALTLGFVLIFKYLPRLIK